MVSPNETLSLAIEKPAAGGRMIARANGQIVLVAGAIPGEQVRARVERVGKGVAFADTIAVDEASPDRRTPFADPLCGGCLFGHIAYPRQLDIKRDVIADAFARIGHVALPSDVRVAASPEEGYRMRARLHVRGRQFGFFREGTHEVCDARQTRQLLPATCATLDRLMAVTRSLGIDLLKEIEVSENVAATERAVHVETLRPLDSRMTEKLVSVDGLTPGPYVHDVLTVDGASVRLRRHVLAFFQGNRYLLGDLVTHVAAQVPSEGELVDLYAGVGLFSIAVAVTRGIPVRAVEGDCAASADLDANAASAGGSVVPVHESVEAFCAHASRPEHRRTVIVDPPRTGMSREALEGVLRLNGQRIIYVSCDVATLARDARRIVDAGYAIERADAFDLFPNTPHVETVVAFRR